MTLIAFIGVGLAWPQPSSLILIQMLFSQFVTYMMTRKPI